ncbi:uncharacterized protein PAE49_014768 [Odontesthes bonariensis]|uniref:uncharacterized protein LOC142397296 n=1 Tax=Odontesthes bonariensis TaxID=219752 RepID=UPI003F58A76C
MFLVLFTVSFVLFGSSSGSSPHRSICYGKSVKLPERYWPPLYTGPLYFTPKNGGPRIVLMDKGKPKDPRMEDSYKGIYFTDLTKRDEGTFAVPSDGDRLYDVLTLEVRDCAVVVTKDYGHLWEEKLSTKVEFLEFSPPKSQDQLIILWNRTNHQNSREKRLQVVDNVLSISYLTQLDSGYYNFREKDNTLESRRYLEVKENIKHYDVDLKNTLFVKYPWHGGPWTVTFKVTGEEHEVMKDGKLVGEDLWFFRRISAWEDGIEIYPVERRDSGTFEFRDQNGNLAMAVNLNLLPEPFPSEYVAVIVGVGIALLVIVCICCCCRKKKCCKKNRPPAAPAVYHYDANQPSNPVSHAFSNEPTATTHESLMHPPVNIKMTQPEVTPLADPGSAAAASSGYNFLSSDAEPRFELKGPGCPAATCLSSDTPSNDVYNSDKLNFL